MSDSIKRFAGRGHDLNLSAVELSGGPVSNSAGAAGNVNLGSNYNALAKRGVRYDQMAADWIEDRAQEENANTEALANTYGQGISSATAIKAAEIKGEAAKAAADKAAGASKTSSAIGGIASVVTAGIGLLSDESTKHTIERIENACSTLRQLKPVTYYYKEEYSSSPERLHHGFIAQDYKEVMPDATYYDYEINKLCIDTGELIALLVRANQELETRITRLEASNSLAGALVK